MSTDLIAALRAALGEDEATALAATAGPWRHDPGKHHHIAGTPLFEEAVFAGAPGPDATCIAGTGETDDPQSMADARHIARHDPAFVLADIAAKRKLLDLHVPVLGWDGDSHDGSVCVICAEDSHDGGRSGDPYPCATLRLLAEAYGIRGEGRTA